MGIDNFDWVAKSPRGASGGLICIWNCDKLKKEKITEGENFVGVFGFWGVSAIPVHIVNIYSPCHLLGKRALWTSLKNLIMDNGGNWCLMSNFNAIRKEQE